MPAGKTVGVDIRSIGYDTVLELTKTLCGGHNDDQFIKCSDDATPPSNLGTSRSGHFRSVPRFFFARETNEYFGRLESVSFID